MEERSEHKIVLLFGLIFKSLPLDLSGAHEIHIPDLTPALR